MVLSRPDESLVITNYRNRKIKRLYETFKGATDPKRSYEIAKALLREYREKYPKFNADKDEPDAWITVRGTHIPLDESGKAVGGPVEGKSFNHAQSSNKGGKSESTAQSGRTASSAHAIPANHDAKKKFTNSIHWSTPLVIDTPEARNMYVCIKEKDYFTMEEMRDSPVMKQLDAESEKWNKRIGDTSLIDEPERQELRKKIENDFLQAGSAVVVGQDEHGNDIYEFTGEVKKEYKAEIVIGLPASGKSTQIANPDSKKMGAFVFDSDIIKESIPEFKESKGAAANAVHEESKAILASALSRFEKGGDRNGDNLIIPVIGDDYEKMYKKWIAPLEEAGYKVNVKFKDTDPVESLNRNIGRAIGSGRIIPSEVSLGYGDKPRAVFDRCKKNGYCRE